LPVRALLAARPVLTLLVDSLTEQWGSGARKVWARRGPSGRLLLAGRFWPPRNFHARPA